MDIADAAPSKAKLMSGDEYRESLRRLHPVVYVDGRRVESVADEPMLRPGVNALAYTYDFALDPARAPVAVCCAVPVDAQGVTIVSRPAGRAGEKLEHGDALFSRRYGQSTAVVVFDRVFVPWERVFFDAEWEHSRVLTYSYATHHRHTCIAARAGFGDLLIGAGALMCEANGFDDPGAKANLREPMVELIKIVEGFYACGVAASVYATRDEASGVFMPDPVFANIGKLLLATQIYDMHGADACVARRAARRRRLT